ncbi:MAG TPA: HAD hydrolase family protein [Armatimonadota bacterium]
MEVEKRLASIKLLACDVDGVLTDGSIIYGSHNMELKVFNIKDGLAMKVAAWSGFPVVWLTGRSSDAVAHRAAELDVQLFQGANDKDAGLRMIAETRGVALEEIAFIGDDLNDLPAQRICGLPIAVADSAPEVLEIAAYVTKATGGHGAIRETIEFILRGQGRWQAAMDNYLGRLRGTRSVQ